MPEQKQPDPPESASGDFMGGYGVAEARRGKLIRNIALGVIAVAIVGTLGYFYFRTYAQKQVMSEFRDLIQEQNLDAAYAMWCPADKPCPYYSREKFAEDWGASGRYPKIAAAQAEFVDYCNEGVLFNFNYSGEPVVLWVDNNDEIVSFAPSDWLRCPGPHLNFSNFWNTLFPSSEPPAPPQP